MGQKTNEETIARRAKEVEGLIREKKCKGCILCLEDLKEKSATDPALVQDLNDRLLAKAKRVEQLEEQVRKSNSLVNQVCQQNF